MVMMQHGESFNFDPNLPLSIQQANPATDRPLDKLRIDQQKAGITHCAGMRRPLSSIRSVPHQVCLSRAQGGGLHAYVGTYRSDPVWIKVRNPSSIAVQREARFGIDGPGQFARR
jgi:hypothetical protein